MDPRAALDLAEAQLVAGDAEDAAETLHAYSSWRACGGFQPVGGDERARRLLRRARLVLAGATLPAARAARPTSNP